MVRTSRNPDVGMPAVVEAPKTPPPIAKTKIAGASLVPDLDKSRKDGGVSRSYKYWVGVTPNCPVQYITMAGICFPKINENLVDDPMGGTIKRRIPVVGAIVTLNEVQMRRLLKKLPLTVVRFTDADSGTQEEPGTGKNIGDVHQQPRRGQLITIPTKDEIDQRIATNKATREYTPQPNDVPAARFMFAQLCGDQERGSRGDFYPETLETAGLEWPDEM